jgi:hypothetical protein
VRRAGPACTPQRSACACMARGGSAGRVAGADSPIPLPPSRGMRRAWPARAASLLLCLLLLPLLASASGEAAAVRAQPVVCSACCVVLPLPWHAPLTLLSRIQRRRLSAQAAAAAYRRPAARLLRAVSAAHRFPAKMHAELVRVGTGALTDPCRACACVLTASTRAARARVGLAVLSGRTSANEGSAWLTLTHPCLCGLRWPTPGSTRGAHGGPRGAAAQRGRASQRRAAAQPDAAAVAARRSENAPQCVPCVLRPLRVQIHACTLPYAPSLTRLRFPVRSLEGAEPGGGAGAAARRAWAGPSRRENTSARRRAPRRRRLLKAAGTCSLLLV